MCEGKLEEPNYPKKSAVALLPGQPVVRQPKMTNNKYMSFWWTSCLTVLATAILVAWIPNLLSPDPPKGNIDGHVIPKLKKVSEIFRLHLLSEEEKGAAFSVFKDGEIVVDLWGGYADIEAWQPWKKSTVANTFSLYNIAISLSLGLLYERGFVDYENTISAYWPEFGVNGKDKVTVRELLSEQSGLLRLNRSISIENLSNTDKLSEELASQYLSSPGFIQLDSDQGILELYADQLVRRVDPSHRSLKQFFEEEFSSTLGLDFFVGLPLHEQHRAARVRGHGFSIIFEVIFAPMEIIHTLLSYMRSSTFTEMNSIKRLNDPGIRSSSVGSVSGFVSARSLAQLYNDALLVGQNNLSPPIISHSTWSRMTEVPIQSHDTSWARKLGILGDWRMSAAGQVRNSPKGTKIIGYSGFGGQYVFVDKELNISLAYLTNYNSIYRSGLDPRFESLLRALYDSI